VVVRRYEGFGKPSQVPADAASHGRVNRGRRDKLGGLVAKEKLIQGWQGLKKTGMPKTQWGYRESEKHRKKKKKEKNDKRGN